MLDVTGRFLRAFQVTLTVQWGTGPTVTAAQWKDRAENLAAGAFDSSPRVFSFIKEPVFTEQEETP